MSGSFIIGGIIIAWALWSVADRLKEIADALSENKTVKNFSPNENTWKPKVGEICVFFDNQENTMRNTHFIISPFEKVDDRGYFLAASNRVYYDNVRSLSYAQTLTLSDFNITD